MKPTIERVREVFAYDAETGLFTRKVATSRSTKVGECAGTIALHGYVQIRIDGHLDLAHRLAWFYVHGEWPKGQIDHINGVRNDNRIANLRDVSRSMNLQNQRKATATNKTTGMLGAHLHKPSGLFVASIRAEGQHKHLGYFKTPEAAHIAYVAAKRELHEGCTI